MTVTEAIHGRRSIFSFRQVPVPRETLQTILEAAVWAPNHKVTEPWRFVIVDGEAKQALATLYGDLRVAATPESLTDQQRTEVHRKTMEKLLSKPVVAAVVCRPSADPKLAKEDYAATCCCIQNIALAAWEVGVGAQWSTSDLTTDPHSLQILGVDPDNESVVGMVYMGFPQEVPPQKRVPAAARTTWLS